ncbi:MAG: hypothetical protein K0Q73_1686 [Paenibacillus sp.]|jgi:hypothetical protein|nr:hypothetical protein [Paenibacillus sp.]
MNELKKTKIMKRDFSISKMSVTSYNNVFPLRRLRSLVCPRDFEEVNQADNPASPNSIAASRSAPLSLSGS